MKILPLVCGWLVVISSAFGSTADEIRKFNDAYALSERQAVTAYPDTTNAESRIVKRMAALDKEFEKDANPIFNSPDKPMILAKMAAKELGIAAVIQTPFDIAYQRSEELTVAAYPDTTNAESPLVKRMAVLDKEFEKSGNPIFNSPDKPMIVATMAAKELGIKPVCAKPVDTEPKPIPVLNINGGSFNNVTVRKIEPDGIRIVHETGALKILIEWMTPEQRAQYGLTPEGAAQYRKQLAAANTAAYYADQQAETERRAADAQRAQEQAQQQAIARQQQVALAEMNAAASDSFERHANEVRARLQDDAEKQQDARDRSKRTFDDADRERRLKELERAEHDRLNRERSPWGN